MKHDKKAICEYIAAHPELSNVAIAKEVGTSEKTIRRYKKYLTARNETVTTRQDPADAINVLRYKRAYSDLKQDYEAVLTELELKDSMLSHYVLLDECDKNTPVNINKTEERSVVPVIVASDWHIEETVSASITNGLNEYNIDIATDSAKQFFSNACTLVQQTKEHSKVDTVVFAILGDIINGVLRSEDLENNQLTSIEALSLARSILYSGIKFLMTETGCNIRVLCCVGNHGRLTEKIHFSNQVKNNLEFLMYNTLKRDFRDYDKVTVVVPESPYIIQEIYGIRVRFHHGHCARYNGGIGGLAVPILRKTAQMNTIEKADLDVIGHFHSMQVFNNVIINGSLVGSNGYSIALGFPFEPPQQTFFLIDSKYGRSMITPIFVDRIVSKNIVPAIK